MTHDKTSFEHNKALEVYEIISPLVIASGMELVDVEYRREQVGMVLRLTIDKDGGVTIDDCTKISRLASDILDARDIIDGSYHLEVSSPGINRALKRPRDFKRFKGEKVYIVTKNPVDGRRKFKGILKDFLKDSNNTEYIHVAVPTAGDYKISLANIRKARLDIL